MADLAAGAEIQLAILLASLAKMLEFEISVILFNEGRLANELQGLGIDTHIILESEHNFLFLSKLLVDYFGGHQVDILHTHKYKDNILANIASIGRGVRARVRTVHGLPEPFVGFEAAKMAVYESIDSWVNRWLVDRLLAVSLDLSCRLAKRFGVGKVTCIHNAIDIENIQVTGTNRELRKELKLDEHDFVIGTMGRLVPVKGLDSFLRAARIIRLQKTSHVKFIIVGDGPLKKSLQATAHEYGLDDDVLFLGHRNDAHNILDLMDLFVLPSLNEGIPIVLLEALALARPVVATRVGGIPEIVEHGVNGLLVSPDRDDELAQTCVTVMDDRCFGRRLGIAGRKRIEQEFSAHVMAEKVAEVYRTLAKGGRNR